MLDFLLKRYIIFLVLTIFSGVILAGCTKESNNSPSSLSKDTVTLGILYQSAEITKMVRQFNENSSDYEIGIINYENHESPLDQMIYEIISGRGPDIINFGGGYSESLIVRGLTVDLYEMMAADKDFQFEDYYGNILESMAIGGHLYAISPQYKIISFAGKGRFSDYKSWTIKEMYQYFSQLPEGSIFFPGDTKEAVFGYLCMGSMNNFIDWDTGKCHFTSEDFKDMLLFSNTFRSEFSLDEDKSILGMYQNGEALLYPSSIENVWQAAAARIILNSQDITYIGYPVTEADKKNGSTGNVVKMSEIILGINRQSDKKEIAWEFIKSFLEKEFQESTYDALPIHRQVMEDRIEKALSGVCAEDAEYSIRFEGEDALPITRITDGDAQQFRNIVETTTRSSSVDYDLYNMIRDEAAYFFNGAKTLGDTADIIQRRVEMYVEERY